MPITSPGWLSSGPPELPGLTAASNWMRPCCVVPSSARIVRSSAEITPEVVVSSRPSGLPTATTGSPTPTPSPPSTAGTTTDGSVAGRSTAMSRAGSDVGDLGGRAGAVGVDDLDRRGVVDDVVGGEDRAVLVDDHAGAEPGELAAGGGRDGLVGTTSISTTDGWIFWKTAATDLALRRDGLADGVVDRRHDRCADRRGRRVDVVPATGSQRLTTTATTATTATIATTTTHGGRRRAVRRGSRPGVDVAHRHRRPPSRGCDRNRMPDPTSPGQVVGAAAGPSEPYLPARHAAAQSSGESDDGVGHVGLLEARRSPRRSGRVDRGHRVVEVLGLRGADDRRRDGGLGAQPGQRDLRPRHAPRRRDLGRPGRRPPGRPPTCRRGSAELVGLRALVASSQSRVSRPRASGLQGITPTPSSAHSGSISRSSSR